MKSEKDKDFQECSDIWFDFIENSDSEDITDLREKLTKKHSLSLTFDEASLFYS